MLGRLRMDVEQCIDAYSNLSRKVFSKKSLISIPFSFRGNFRAKYDTSKLAAAVKEIIEESGLDVDTPLNNSEDRGCRVFVCAARKENKVIARLRDYRSDRALVNDTARIWEAARATSAASGFFEPIAIGKHQQEYVDAGLGCNNPVNEVWTEAQDIFLSQERDDLDTHLKCFVSIGTGNPGTSPVEDGALKIFYRTSKEIATETENTAESFKKSHRSLAFQKRYFRFNVEQRLQDVGLEEFERQKEIVSATSTYMEFQRMQSQRRDCAQAMKDKGSRSMSWKRCAFTRPQDMEDEKVMEWNWGQSDELSQCLQALYTSDYRAFKARNFDRVPGTCQWFLGNEKYKKWIENTSSDLLWVTADPGCGKSVLSKSLIDHEFRTLSPSITCHFFFKDDNADQKSATKAVCALLHQILDICNDSASLQKALNVFRSHGSQMSQSFHILWDLLLDIAGVATASQILCVLDALDECEEDGKEMLIRSLNTFSSTVNGRTGRLKILVTGRPYYHIEERFSDRIIRLAGEDETKLIQGEIDLVIRHRVPGVARQSRLDPATQNVLQTRLLETRNRTYLWLHLTLEDVIKRSPEVKTPKPMERFLKEIPATLYDAYEQILNSSPDIKTARKLLSIIVVAVRPLTLREMNMALNIEEGDKAREDVDLIQEDIFPSYIKNTCGLFVSIYDSKLYLLHQTAREFLISHGKIPHTTDRISPPRVVWRNSIELDIANLILTRICFIYLFFAVFEDEPLSLRDRTPHNNHTNNPANVIDKGFLEGKEHGLQLIYTLPEGFDLDKMRQYAEKYDFLEYASRYWVQHFRLASQDSRLNEWWLHICNTVSTRFCTWFQLKCALDDRPSMVSQYQTMSYPSYFSPLMVASYLGHSAMVEQLCEKEQINARNSKDKTALWWAVQKGQASTVRILLRKGAMQIQDRIQGHAPLMIAVYKESKEMVCLLIDEGLPAHSKDTDGRTPLAYAVKFMRESMTELLLKKGAPVDSVDNDDKSPVLYTIEYGQVETMKLLFNYGAEVDLRDRSGRAPLTHAVIQRKDGMIKPLLEQGASAELADNRGRTPLCYAAEGGQEEILELLFSQGAATDSVATNGRTPLSYAAGAGQEATVKLLLEKGAAIDLTDQAGRTSLSFAALAGFGETVKILLERGATVNSRDVKGFTPLYLATHRCYDNLKFFTSRDADIVWLSLNEMSENAKIVKYLLEMDTQIGPDLKDKDWIFRAFVGEYQEVLKALIDYGADHEDKDWMFRAFVGEEYQEVMKALKDYDADQESEH